MRYYTMEKKFITAFTALIVIAALLGATACTPTVTLDDAKLMAQSAAIEATNKAQVQIDALKAQVSSIEADKKTAEDAKTALTEKLSELDAKVAELSKLNTSSGVSASGKSFNRLNLGDTLNENVDNSDIKTLWDGNVEFADDDYSTHEEFSINTDVAYSGNTTYDSEFYGDARLVALNEGALSYRYVFDDQINISDVSRDEPLAISFMGKDMKIVDISSGSVTIQEGTQLALTEGETATVDGKTITLVSTSDAKALVDVNGIRAAINEGDSKKVNGIDVQVDEAIGSDKLGYAELIVGKDVETTIDNGDNWFKNDDRFVFNIVTSSGMLSELSISYDVKFDNADDDFAPLKIGESINFPNNYVNILFDGKKVDATDVSITIDKIYKSGVDENAVILKANDEIFRVGNKDVKTVYVIADGTFYFKNNDGNIEKTTLSPVIKNDNTEVSIALAGTLMLTDSNGKKIELAVDIANKQLGAKKDDAESGDVIYEAHSFGTLDGSLLTQWGIVVKDIKSNADNDKVVLSIPSDQTEYEVVISNGS